MKDIILIGLGDFGEKTISVFKDFLEDRKYLLPDDLRDKITIHDLVFKNNNSFDFNFVSQKISNKVEHTDTRKFNKSFGYVFIGDLSENITSKYAVDYSIVPLVLDMNKTIMRDKDNVFGFFTFSDRIGTEIKKTDAQMTDMLSFFKKYEKICSDETYAIPFKDISGRDIPDVNTSAGIFTRNYIFATPGGQEVVNEMASQVFAERIFYELYYLSDSYSKKTFATKNKKNCFSTFSMIQISKLEELQKYYLKYQLEGKIIDFYLDGTNRTNQDYDKKEFFKKIDISQDGKFPVEKALKIFKKNESNQITKFLIPYVSQADSDTNNYAEECKKEVESKIHELKPKYDDFARAEVENLIREPLEKGLSDLFKTDRLSGHLNSYIEYVDELKRIFISWSEDLQKKLEAIEENDIEKKLEKCKKKITHIQKSSLYKIPFFIPLRKLIIISTMNKMNLRGYMENEIKRNLIYSFIEALKDNELENICDKFISNLNKIKELLEQKRKQVNEKKEFIEKIPNYFYVISQKIGDEYRNTLEIIGQTNFEGKKSSIDDVAKNLFKEWTRDNTGKEKHWISITQNSKEFISFVDSYIEKNYEKNGFCKIEDNASIRSDFVDHAVVDMEDKITSLSKNTFTVQATDFIDIFVCPDLNGKDDILDEKIKNLSRVKEGSAKQLFVNKEFTLGSVTNFRDSLFLNYKDLSQYQILFKNYEDGAPEELKYVNDSSSSNNEVATETAHSSISQQKNSNASIVDKSSMEFLLNRAILSHYAEPFVKSYFYEQKTGQKVEELSKNQIEELSCLVKVEEVLESLDDDKLNEIAKEFADEIGYAIDSDKETQISLIRAALNRQN